MSKAFFEMSVAASALLYLASPANDERFIA